MTMSADEQRAGIWRRVRQVHRRAFDRLRSAISEDYSYRDLRGVDWGERFAKLGAGLCSSRTAIEFAEKAAVMLGPARDIHLWLRVKGQMLPTHRRCVGRNVNLGLLPKVVPGWRQCNPMVASGRFLGGIVYLCLRAWPPNAPEQLEPAFRLVRRAAAQRLPLIVDARANGGGAEPLAARFAGRFISRTVCYAKHLRCRHGRLLGPVERWLKPSATHWRFHGRVAVLVGPGTVSSCESFAMMMRQVPGCKLIGQRTAGASGNSKPVALGNGVVLFVPTWWDMELDGACLEGRGLQPDVEVDAASGLAAGRDPVLAAAVELLRRQPARR